MNWLSFEMLDVLPVKSLDAILDGQGNPLLVLGLSWVTLIIYIISSFLLEMDKS